MVTLTGTLFFLFLWFFRLCTSLMSKFIRDIMFLQRLGVIGIFLIVIYFLYWKKHTYTLPIYDDTSARWASNLGSGGPTAPQLEARENETMERAKNRIKSPHNF
jgi:hypothetical protein